jgi:hypothetical protein
VPSIKSVRGSTSVNHFQVGASGDTGSTGNNGVETDIRTHVYTMSSLDSGDSFWVGDDLVGGGFVQFGYEINYPGYYCLRGSVVGGQSQCTGNSDTIGINDARWFWEYWPQATGNDYYWGDGPASSVCCEGSWHTYEIKSNSEFGWDFVLDGQLVDSFIPAIGEGQVSIIMTNAVASTHPVYVIAEKVTSSSQPDNLGPVEFRNLGYFKINTWHHVSSLYASRNCSIINPTCAGINNPYGVSLNGPNDILAGSGQNEVLDGTVLWMGSPTLTLQVPSQVPITLDGVVESPGGIVMSLSQGTHYVSVPSFVVLDNETRQRFVDWLDMDTASVITDPNITINLHSDAYVVANFATQYKLTVAGTLYSPESDEWYDSGTNGTFSISNQYLPVIFVGFDQGGNLITTSTTGTVLMNGPRTVVPEWRLNYVIIAIPIALIAILIVTLSRRRSRKKSEGKEERKRGWLLSPLDADR